MPTGEPEGARGMPTGEPEGACGKQASITRARLPPRILSRSAFGTSLAAKCTHIEYELSLVPRALAGQNSGIFKELRQSLDWHQDMKCWWHLQNPDTEASLMCRIKSLLVCLNFCYSSWTWPSVFQLVNITLKASQHVQRKWFKHFWKPECEWRGRSTGLAHSVALLPPGCAVRLWPLSLSVLKSRHYCRPQGTPWELKVK